MATRTSIINSAGTIQPAIGDARIIGADGSTRVAHIGEKVFPREMIMTAANAAVHFQLEDGCLLDIGQESGVTLSADAGASDVMLAVAAQPSVAAMQASIPTGGEVVGTITIAVGNVKIIGVDSVPRVATVGDKVLSKETLATESDGIVQVQLKNGKSIDLGGDSKLALTDGIIVEAGDAVSFVTDTPAPVLPVAPEQDAAAIQEAIAAGQDPSQVAAVTAAGSDGSGATPVVIDQSNSTGEVTSGFPTQPAGTAFPEIRPDVLPEVRANLVTGLTLTDEIVIHTDPGYGRVEIDNAISPDPSSLKGESFDSGDFGYFVENVGTPLDLSLDTTLTDGDANTSTSAIDLTLDPSASPSEISGDSDNDILFGGGGNDILVYDPADLSETATTVYNGASGDDTLRFDGSAQSLNVTALADTRIQNIQTIDLNGTGDDTLALKLQDVLDLSSTTNQLLVMGNAGDVVDAPGQGWLTVGAPVSMSGQIYQAYTDGRATATLLVDTDVTRNIF